MKHRALLVPALAALGLATTLHAQTFTSQIADPGPGMAGMNSSALVVAGNPAVSYYDQTALKLKFARNSMADGLGTWSVTIVDPASGTGNNSSLAIVAGCPAISYQDATNSDLKFARNSAADGTGTWTITTVDSAGQVGSSNSSLVIVGGFPAIAYYDLTNGDLKFARNSAADGSGTWTLTTVDTTGNVGAFASLAIVDGLPAIAYQDITNGDLKFARNSMADGSGVWTPVTVDSAGTTGGYTSLLTVSGNPAISYYDPINGDLRFARNSASDGSGTWTPVTVDSAGTVGAYTSMKIVDGNPAISYHDNTNKDLKFARNSAADGSGTWTIYTAESEGEAGNTSSLFVVDGKPAITHCHDTESDLKFAHASSSDGSGIWSSVVVDIGAPGRAGSYASQAIINGNPAMAYHESLLNSIRYARNSAADGSGTWSYTMVDTNPGTTAVGFKISLAQVDGKPAISYYTTIGQDLKFARSSTADGSGPWTITTVAGAGSAGQYSSLAVIGGFPCISFWDSTNTDLKFARNSAADGSGTWTIVTVDDHGHVGPYSSLALIDGKPAIAYQDLTNLDLKFARCSTLDGSGTWSHANVDGVGISVGTHVSLAAIDGRPGIAYHNDSSLDLKFVRNSAADGSGTWTAVTVDATGNVGTFASLAWVNTIPVISYYDDSNDDLKFARNSAADGSGAWTTSVADGSGPGAHMGQYSSMASVAGRPAISYYDEGVHDLRWALHALAPEIVIEDQMGGSLPSGTAVVSLGNTGVGVPAREMTFTIRNAGFGALSLSPPTVSGGDAVHFSVDGSSIPSSMLAGKPVTFTATFTPPAPGPYSITLSLVNGDADENPFLITLIGTGVPPEIGVEHPAGTGLVAGTASVGFGGLPSGLSSPPKVFTIRNTGAGILTLATPVTVGGDAGAFSVDAGAVPASLLVGQSATFSVIFVPGPGGPRSTTLRIGNSDGDEAPFDITLTGTSLTHTADTDGDGLNDASEYHMAALGFDWEVNQEELVDTLYNHAEGAGLYTAEQVQALHIDKPMIQRDPLTGVFTLTLGLKKATELAPPNYTPFPFTVSGVSVNGEGKIEFDFLSEEPAAFFILEVD